MTKKWTRIQKTVVVAVLLMCISLFSLWSIALAGAQDSTLAPVTVQAYAQQQANALGSSSPDWKSAQLDYYPLGPGTHSWLVQATIQDKQIGYMIISVTEQGGLQLSEYGQGELSPYNNDLLGQALKRQSLNLNTLYASGGELTLRYAPPLMAYWKVERPNHPALYIDATNGDLLPSETLTRLEYSIRPNLLGLTSPTGTSTDSYPTLSTSPLEYYSTFDPAEHLSWLTSQPIPVNEVEAQILHGKHQSLVFSAGERNLFYGGPLPVSGYQQWHTKLSKTELSKADSLSHTQSILFVAIGGHTSSQRFVPLTTLLQDGQFYVAKP